MKLVFQNNQIETSSDSHSKFVRPRFLKFLLALLAEFPLEKLLAMVCLILFSSIPLVCLRSFARVLISIREPNAMPDLKCLILLKKIKK